MTSLPPIIIMIIVKSSIWDYKRLLIARGVTECYNLAAAVIRNNTLTACNAVQTLVTNSTCTSYNIIIEGFIYTLGRGLCLCIFIGRHCMDLLIIDKCMFYKCIPLKIYCITAPLTNKRLILAHAARCHVVSIT